MNIDIQVVEMIASVQFVATFTYLLSRLVYVMWGRG
jgi:hypothetical protein